MGQEETSMTHLRDGSLIEWVQSGKVYGPDSPCTLNYGTTRLYVRIDGGEWLSVGPEVRNLHRLLEWLPLCDTADDLRSLLG